MSNPTLPNLVTALAVRIITLISDNLEDLESKMEGGMEMEKTWGEVGGPRIGYWGRDLGKKLHPLRH